MSHDHAAPPSPEEHRRKLAKLKAYIGYGFFVLIGVVWLLLEFGGESVEEALGFVMLGVFAVWVITWPVRKWNAWQRQRARRRGRAA